MRLKRIEINSLFGIYNHEIDLADGNITLLLGDNGVGKSTIFKLVDALFNEEFSTLLSIDFGRLFIELEDGSFEVVRFIDENGNIDLNICFVDNEGFKSSETLSAIEETRSEAIRQIKRYFPKHYRQIDDDKYRDMISREEFTRAQVVGKFQSIIPDSVKEALVFPKWLKVAISEIDMVYVGAQRILTQVGKDEDGEGVLQYKNTLRIFSEDLVQRIAESVNAASKVATDLDSTFPKRLMKCFQEKDLKVESQVRLSQKLKRIEKIQNELSRVGLVSYDPNSTLTIKNYYGYDRIVISTVLKSYIDDMTVKLAAYQDIYKKLSLFIYLANAYLLDKTLSIDPAKGIVINSVIGDKRTINIDRLSSGEQNVLVLFYDLIFKTDPGSILLLDEPEISLHVVWQRRLVDDLLQVTTINPIQICIATHSPSLINTHWEITQEIESKENGQGE